MDNFERFLADELRAFRKDEVNEIVKDWDFDPEAALTRILVGDESPCDYLKKLIEKKAKSDWDAMDEFDRKRYGTPLAWLP